MIAKDNAYGYNEVWGDGANSGDAYDNALRNLRKHSNAEVNTIIIVYSGNVRPKVINK